MERHKGISRKLTGYMQICGPDVGVWDGRLLVGETNGFRIWCPEKANHSESIRCKVALDVFCPVQIQAPTFLAESVRNELGRDRCREQPLDYDIFCCPGPLAGVVVP
jgi:hypothetical protein